MISVMTSSLCEVVIEVEEDVRNEQVPVQSQLVQVPVLVRDIVVSESLAHVKDRSVVLPSVAEGVSVVVQVTLQDLIQSLF